jgi:apolipoprotein N-acyltransferase
MTPASGWPLPFRLALAFGLGALAASGLAPFHAWYATAPALVLVPLVFGAARRGSEAGWTGWCFGLGYFALALSWIVEPFLVDAARHGWMAPFALLFMAGGLSLFWAAAFWGALHLGRTVATRTWALVLLWSLAEVARGRILTGFPWGAPGQIWVGTDMAQALAVVGPEGLTLVTLAITLPVGLVLLPQTRRLVRGGALLPALGVVAALGAWPGLPEEAAMTNKTVRLVQPNAPQHQKWHPDFIPVFFARQVGFTAEPGRPDLVVWPEASLANHVEGVSDPLGRIGQAAGDAQVALGILRPDADGFFNSLLQLNAAGQPVGLYDKHHLVPFGEYLPFGDVLDRLGLRALARVVPDGMLAGPGPALLDFGALGRALPLICYEAVFSQEVAAMPERADFLLQITNDAWFGEWSGPYQHLAQAQMRAIEQGLPMVRVANTGVSAMIDPYGRIIGQLPLGEAGFADLGLPAPLPPTFYSVYGGFPVFFVQFLLFSGLCAARAGVIRRNSD